MDALHTPTCRRLWDLPEPAHVLLLGLSFTPAVLRADVARALGRHHRVNVELQGSDTDVLFATVHDLGSRNPLSEALQRRLDGAHAATLQRYARLRDAEALAQAFADDCEAGHPAAALWALLTHRLGTALQDTALMRLRSWAVEQARRGGAARQEQCALLGELADLRARELAGRLRAQARQQAVEAEMAQLRQALAQAQGELRRWQEAAQVPARPVPEVLPPGPPAPRRREPAAPAAAAAPPVAAPPRRGATVAGQRVLCVGGVQRAVSRYRARVEQLGGRFEHHDGGAESGVRELEACLQRADLVLCQAGCINHEAYHRIKRHCLARGTPCIFLARPSLAHLDRALDEARRQGEGTAPPGRPPAPVPVSQAERVAP